MIEKRKRKKERENKEEKRKDKQSKERGCIEETEGKINAHIQKIN